MRIITIIICIALTACYCTLPLLTQQSLPAGHDMLLHVFQADQFQRSIASGNIYPRWMSDANNGLGSPTFIFYAPLSYYVVAVIHTMAPSFGHSMIIAIWVSFFLSGVTMYVTANKIYSKTDSLLTAIIYQILPFHLLDLYNRGTLAELYAYVLVPLVFLSLHRISTTKNSFWSAIGLSFSYAGLVLTHLVTGFMTSVVAGIYIVYISCARKDKRIFLVSTSALISGLGLSFFYLFPAFFEQKYVHIDYITNCMVCDYKENFLFSLKEIPQILEDFYQQLHIATLLEVTFFLYAITILFKIRNNELFNSTNLIYYFLFALAFYLTTPLSSAAWNFIPGFSKLQFPWRWILIMELLLCIIVADIFNRVQLQPRLKLMTRLYLLTPIAIISALIIFKANMLPEKERTLLDSPLQLRRYLEYTWEYLPIWTDIEAETIENQNKKDIRIVSGVAKYYITDWLPGRRNGEINATTPAKVQIGTFYYPGWQLSIDGKETPFEIQNKSGMMTFYIPQGRHSFSFTFEDTLLRSTSKIISLLFFIVVLSCTVNKSYQIKSLSTRRY